MSQSEDKTKKTELSLEEFLNSPEAEELARLVGGIVAKNIDSVDAVQKLISIQPGLDEDQLAVKSYKEDLLAGRVNPREHPAWDARVIC